MEILPATSDLWPQLADLFTRRGGPDTPFCWCIFWRVRSKDFTEATTASNRERLRGLVEAGPPPGLVAIEDGRAIGWVGLAPRPEYQRIEHSRVIPRTDGPVPWSIACFVVSRDARGRGVAGALLAAAVEHARAAGAAAVEGYPIDPTALPGRACARHRGVRRDPLDVREGRLPRRGPDHLRQRRAPRVVVRLDFD